MKKLICAVLAAGSMLAFAEEAACKDGACKDGACKIAAAAETVKDAPKRGQLTSEQRAEMKARREKIMAERKAAMEAKLLEVVKKYVPEEEKAKALIKELEETMKPLARRQLPRPAMKPAEKAE